MVYSSRGEKNISDYFPIFVSVALKDIVFVIGNDFIYQSLISYRFLSSLFLVKKEQTQFSSMKTQSFLCQLVTSYNFCVVVTFTYI